MELAQKKCVPPDGKTPPLNRNESAAFLKHVNAWAVTDDGKCLIKTFKLTDFAAAMRFANDISTIAVTESHYPDLAVSPGRVTVELATHSIRGLSENDFIVAAKIDQLK